MSPLFDAGEKRAKHGSTRALVPLDPDTCPRCDSELRHVASDQPALLRHGGYGADRRSEMSTCPACGFEGASTIGETRPA